MLYNGYDGIGSALNWFDTYGDDISRFNVLKSKLTARLFLPLESVQISREKTTIFTSAKFCTRIPELCSCL